MHNLHRIAPFALIAGLMLASCEPVPGGGAEILEIDSPDEAAVHFMKPVYGEVQPISGEYSSFIETSAISLCNDVNNCQPPRNIDGSIQSCWVEFADASNPDKFYADVGTGSYWVEGRGRIAVLPGSFGHLGQYTCQIEMSRIDRVEQMRGYYEPPPPGTQ